MYSIPFFIVFVSSGQKSVPSKLPEKLPVAFLMAEKIEVPSNAVPGCLSAHTAMEDGQPDENAWRVIQHSLKHSFNIPNFKEIYRSFNVNECITSVLELIVKPVCHCLSSREFIAKSLQHIKFIYWSVTNVGLKRLSKKKNGVLVVVVLFLANPMRASSNSDWATFSLICLVVMISVPNWIDCYMLHFVLRNR